MVAYLVIRDNEILNIAFSRDEALRLMKKEETATFNFLIDNVCTGSARVARTEAHNRVTIDYIKDDKVCNGMDNKIYEFAIIPIAIFDDLQLID